MSLLLSACGGEPPPGDDNSQAAPLISGGSVPPGGCPGGSWNACRGVCTDERGDGRSLCALIGRWGGTWCLDAVDQRYSDCIGGCNSSCWYTGNPFDLKAL